MKKLMIVVITLAVVLCVILGFRACNKKTADAVQPTATPENLSEPTAQAVTGQNEAGVLIGTVSHLSTSRMLVVEADENVYCFDIPIDTDRTNMFAGNNVMVEFTGKLDPSIGTSYQNVVVTKITFDEPVAIEEIKPAQEVQTQTEKKEEIATQDAEGNAIIYMWTDGTMHNEPEAGQQAVTASQVATIQFTEPQLTGPINSCNGTIVGIVEDGKYIILDDGAGHQFMFYIEGKNIKSYDGTGVEVGANCSVLYIGTLNPYYGASTPQYVTVQNVQTDSKAYYNYVTTPKKSTKTIVGQEKMWYGSDGNVHWYGVDGKVYNYDSNGNIVLS